MDWWIAINRPVNWIVFILCYNRKCGKVITVNGVAKYLGIFREAIILVVLLTLIREIGDYFEFIAEGVLEFLDGYALSL